MRHLSNTILTFFLPFIFLALIGCELKPCEGYPCVNGTPQPDAEDCYCICNSGWRGSDCTIENVCITRKVVCVNGNCNNGICICDNGFEGDSCELYVRDKFVGTFTAIDFCTITGQLQYAMTINSTSNLLSILFSTQLADNKFPDDSLLATVNNNTFKLINNQEVGVNIEVSGSGSISNDTLTLLYIMTNLSVSPAEVDSCSGTWIKQ